MSNDSVRPAGSKKPIKETSVYKFCYWTISLFGSFFSIFKWTRSNSVIRHIFGVFRAGFWRGLSTKIGKGTLIDSGVVIRYHPEKLTIGDYSHIDVRVQLEIHEKMRIGSYVHICPNVYLQSGAELIIEDYACVSNGSRIYTTSNTYGSKKGEFVSLSSNAPKEFQRFKKGTVKICRNAFLGIDSIVLPGVVIGENAIVGAGSVVLNDIPPNTIAAGIPAKVIKQRPDISNGSSKK